MVRKIVVRYTLKTAPSRAIVEFPVDLRECCLAIRIFPITPVHMYLFEEEKVEIAGVHTPKLEILVSREVHDHESTSSTPGTAPVFSKQGNERSDGPPRVNIEVGQSLKLGRIGI